jgi:hypothetical protein
MTLSEIKSNLKKDYPKIVELHNGEEVELSASEYNLRIEEWAANIQAKEAEEAALQAKADAKEAVLAKLGLTAEEAAALLA